MRYGIIFALTGAVIGLLFAVFVLDTRVDSLITETEILNSRIKFVENQVDYRADSLQDSLEERIGTIERDLDGIKFITGGTTNE